MRFEFSLATAATLVLGASAVPLQTVLGQGSSFGVPGADATFDYVIVGGGTAGLAMALRLSEDGTNTVAVIEAGDFYELGNGNLSVVPGFGTFLTGSDPNNTQPLVDWGFVTTPQRGAANREMHYARGKVLGGSSARNYMVYQRPTVESMQQWANDVGDQSYTFNNTLPYFEKSAHFTPQNQALFTNTTNPQTSAGFSTTGGPLEVSYANYVDPFSTYVQPAFKTAGQKEIDGFNTGSLIGSGWVTWTIDPTNAHRSSSQTSFLDTALNTTTTLQVYTQSLATKILFSKDLTATGVSVITQGTFGTPSIEYTLSATKEVIISAGAFQSPQLLMVSGIGPESTLKAHGIPCLKNLPGVGQNLWDQPLFGTAHRINMLTSSAPQNNPALLYEADAAWIEAAAGPLAEFGSGYFGWEKLPASLRSNLSAATLAALATFPADWPEIEYLPVNAYLGYQRDYQTEDPLDGFNYATIASALVAPLSRGNLTIKSSSMLDPPIINPNWLTAPADIELAIATFKRQRQIWAILASYNITIGPEYLPGPKVQSDADILTFIRESVIEIWHASATCKMGKSSDTEAVVDSKARVFGTSNLRVVDASAFPFLPPGHPQSVVYMLAEKIAADILDGN